MFFNIKKSGQYLAIPGHLYFRDPDQPNYGLRLIVRYDPWNPKRPIISNCYAVELADESGPTTDN